MLKRQSVWFILACGIIATSDATAQVTSQVIVKTGDLVPGSASGEVFQSYEFPQGSSTIRVPAFITPVLDQAGRATFFGATGTRFAPYPTVRWSGDGLTNLFWSTDAIDPDLSPPSLWTLGIRRGGSLLGTGQRPDGRGVIVAGNPLRYVVSSGDPITDRPQLGNWQVNFPTYDTQWADVNSHGDVLFSDRSRSILGIGAVGQPARVVLASGDTVGTETVLNFTRPAISSDGTIFARYQGAFSRGGIVAGRPRAMRTLLTSGNLPGLPAGSVVDSFDSIGTPTAFQPPIVEHAEDGSVATTASVGTPDPAIGRFVVFGGSSDGMRAIWHSKQVMPGLPIGWTPSNSEARGLIAANDRVTALQSFFNDATGLPRNVIAVGQGDALRAAVRGGDTVPGVPGATLGQLGLFGTNRWQDVLFSSLMVGPGIGVESDAVLMVATMDQGPLVLLREGQALTLSPGDVRTVLGFGSIPAARNVSINDLRQVLIDVRFTDNTDALILFTVPAPSMGTLLAGLGLLAIRRRRAARS